MVQERTVSPAAYINHKNGATENEESLRLLSTSPMPVTISHNPNPASSYNNHGNVGGEDSHENSIVSQYPDSSLNSELYSFNTAHNATRRRRRRRISHRTSFRFSECDADEDLPQFHGSRKIQYFSALAANMGAFALGTVLSWSAVALPDLRKDEDFTNTLTEKAETWIGSIITLGAVASGPASGYLIEKFGRRFTMLILNGPFLLGWLLIYFASSIELIFVGRFITGFCSGVFAVAAPIFTAEMADVNIRGTLCAGFDCMISVGILFIYVLGAFASWRVQSLICSIFPVIIFIMMLFVPESPRYLVAKGKWSEAVEALMKFRGAFIKEQVEEELKALRVTISHMHPDGRSITFKEFFSGPIIRPVSIAFFIYFFQAFSGIDPVLFYTVDIFHSAGAQLDDYTSTIIIGSVQVFFAAIGAFMVEYYGRRVLLMLSEIVMVISLAFLGLYFYIKAENEGIPPGTGIEASWWWDILPLASLIVYTIAYSLGVGPVGYMIMSEVLPHRVKGLAGCILTSLKWFMSFMMTKFFQDVIKLVGSDGCYWLFAGFCFVGLIYIYMFVPETKGKTLDEIQQEFADSTAFRETRYNNWIQDGGGKEKLLSGSFSAPLRKNSSHALINGVVEEECEYEYQEEENKTQPLRTYDTFA